CAAGAVENETSLQMQECPKYKKRGPVALQLSGEAYTAAKQAQLCTLLCNADENPKGTAHVAVEEKRIAAIAVAGLFRDQQGSRTLTPACWSSAFSARESVTPKWKMLAASAASARPAPNTSAKCCALPAPPDAMTGICTAALTAAVSSQSKPVRMPSVSMLVRRISPAPRCSASRAHSMTRRPVGFRPPAMKTSASAGSFSRGVPAPLRASMATITACAPKDEP